MNAKRLFPAVLVIAALLAPAAQGASDYAKEKRWADQIVGSLFVGKAIYLKADGHKFLALYTLPQTSKAKGGIIVMHGLGVHPNWADVIYPLRTELPQDGWYTLSIQMPVLANGVASDRYGPLLPEADARIGAAIAFLKSKGVHNIVFVCHSLGNSMAGHFLAHHPGAGVHAWVGVGMSLVPFKDPSLLLTTSLAKIRLPILDLYGSQDLKEVLGSVGARAAAAKKAGNTQYTQLEVKGADHFFHDKDAILMKDVRAWLDKYAVK